MTSGRVFSYLKLSVTLTLLLVFAGTSLLFLNSDVLKDNQTRLEDFKSAFTTKLNLSGFILNRIESLYQSDMPDDRVLYTARKLGDTYSELHIAFYFLNKNGKKYWSSSELPSALLSQKSNRSNGIKQIGINYWYIFDVVSPKGIFGAAILLKREYPDKLGNEVFIPEDLEIGRQFDVLSSPCPGSYNLYDTKGKYLFSVDLNGNSNYTYRPVSALGYAILATAFLLFLLFLTFLAEIPFIEKYYTLYLLIVAVLLLLMRYFGIVLSAFRSENLIMYYKVQGSPEAFFIPSLSAFFANSLIFLFFIHLISRPFYRDNPLRSEFTGIRQKLAAGFFILLS
jgi:hypothetical protein